MSSEWYCEANVVASVVQHLRQEGWAIESIADTESRERGADIRAKRNGEALIVEAKGYPVEVYARGEKKGQPKPTKPGVQARHWYSQVLFDAILRQNEYPSANVVIALPRFSVFTNLIDRTRHALRNLHIGVFLVSEPDAVVVVNLDQVEWEHAIPS